MRKELKALYTLSEKNVVLIWDTNLKCFLDKIRMIDPNFNSYYYFYETFKKANLVKQKIHGRTFFIQKSKP